MATVVSFPPPCDPDHDLDSWFTAKGYTLDEVSSGTHCWTATLVEDLDAAQQTQLASDLREEVVYPVTFS